MIRPSRPWSCSRKYRLWLEVIDDRLFQVVDQETDIGPEITLGWVGGGRKGAEGGGGLLFHQTRKRITERITDPMREAPSNIFFMPGGAMFLMSPDRA